MESNGGVKVATLTTQHETIGRVATSPFRMIGKVARVFVKIMLIIVIVVIGVVGIWSLQKIETGVGEMTRLRAGIIYLRLATRMPWGCIVTYGTYVPVSFITAPLFALDEAFDFSGYEIEVGGRTKKSIEWTEVPEESWSVLKDDMYQIFHGRGSPQYRCYLPEPHLWTSETIGQ